MIFLKNFTKRLFSTKINFVPNTSNIKNLLYFGSESDILSNPDYSKVFKNELRIKDFKKKKVDSSYSWSQDPSICRYSERLVLASVTDDPESNRDLTSKIIRGIQSFNELHIKFSSGLTLSQRRILLNSILLTNYKFSKKSEIKIDDNQEDNNIVEQPPKDKFIREINIVEDEVIVNNRENIKFWIDMANASLFTRNLANERGNPDYLESEARKVIKEINSPDVNIEVIKGKKLAENNLNLLYSVGKSAESEPRLIILSFKGNKNESNFQYSVVGKGVTFDTGGLNLKPTNHIEDMYLDKHGACNALAVFKYAVKQELPINLVCVLACAENSIDSNSYKPSDIISSYKGLTVEITNTDAEGRLCLADALSYVQKNYGPNHIIDLATLTGACMVALGNKTAGMFTNDYDFAEKLNNASEETLEPVWQLPITKEHREDMKSKTADIKNSEKSRYAGASKGAAFLEYFIEKDTKWIHLDIAGPSTCNAASGIYSEGATGFGTQLVLKFLYNECYGTEIVEGIPFKQETEENEVMKMIISDPLKDKIENLKNSLDHTIN